MVLFVFWIVHDPVTRVYSVLIREFCSFQNTHMYSTLLALVAEYEAEDVVAQSGFET